MSRYLQRTLPVYCLNCHASNLHFNVQTLKMQFFVQLQLYLVATSTTRAVSTTLHKLHGDRYSSLVWCLSTRVFCGMMYGLAFLPVLDLTNGIHLLRTLCPDDRPEAAELLDYFIQLSSVVDLDNRIQHKRYSDGQPGIHATDIITPAVCLRC